MLGFEVATKSAAAVAAEPTSATGKSHAMLSFLRDISVSPSG